MHEMRKTGGYMTVEISALLPIILMVLWMFFSYLFYFMNCGIAQGIMEEAVQKAREISESGDVVTLSPACASFDMYPNFEARGIHYKNLVKEL